MLFGFEGNRPHDKPAEDVNPLCVVAGVVKVYAARALPFVAYHIEEIVASPLHAEGENAPLPHLALRVILANRPQSLAKDKLADLVGVNEVQIGFGDSVINHTT